MTRLAALLLVLAAALPARAADPHWTRQGASLLLYDKDGALAQELPLRAPDESANNTRETMGGVSPDGRLAWTLDRRAAWAPGRTRLLDSKSLLRVYGEAGVELWNDETADAPERGEPVAFSADGKTLLYARRAADGRYAEAREWMGRTLYVLGPFPRLIATAITPNGRYLLARWGVPDKDDTHTFVDLKTKKRRDVESSTLVLGQARVGDDGAVLSGTKTVFAFETAAVAVSTRAYATFASTGAAVSARAPVDASTSAYASFASSAAAAVPKPEKK